MVDWLTQTDLRTARPQLGVKHQTRGAVSDVHGTSSVAHDVVRRQNVPGVRIVAVWQTQTAGLARDAFRTIQTVADDVVTWRSGTIGRNSQQSQSRIAPNPDFLTAEKSGSRFACTTRQFAPK